MVMDSHVAGQQGAVGDDDAVADVTVMGDVTAGHQEATAADDGHPFFFLRGPVHGDAFAQHVAVADHDASPAAPVAQILRLGPITTPGYNWLNSPIVTQPVTVTWFSNGYRGRSSRRDPPRRRDRFPHRRPVRRADRHGLVGDHHGHGPNASVRFVRLGSLFPIGMLCARTTFSAATSSAFSRCPLQ
jgi:hypothetical protein